MSSQPQSPASGQNNPQEFLQLAALGGWTFDPASDQLSLTPLAGRIFGIPPGVDASLHLSRKMLNARIDERDRELVDARWKEGLAGHPYELTYRLLSSPGETIWVWEKAQFVYDATGKTVSAKGVVQDVSLRRSMDTTLANIDPLTGLPNRELLTEHLELQIPLARRLERKLAVLFIDLDGFKQVNDNHGHATGDKLLRQVAYRMKECLRESDMVARQGGDEFIVVLQDVSADADAGIIALKLIESIGQVYDLDGTQVNIGASVGVATFPADGTDAKTLIQNADMAMYLSKSSGRETLKFFGPNLASKARDRRNIQNEISRAIEEQQFLMHYQPVFGLDSGLVKEVESLLRWNHPKRGLLEATNFIFAAEENGMIREIGRWVLRAVLQDAAKWQARGQDHTITVNISAQQIPDGLPVDWLAGLIEQSKADASKLVFELTESTLMQDSPGVHRWLKDVEKLGIRFSLGSFGSGYSSLGFLRISPVRQLKIDRTLVREMLKSPEQYAMVKSIIEIGRNLELKVCAAGVEDAATLQALKKLGCHSAQGFHLSHPVVAAGAIPL